jgi:hypothetical protein
MAHKKELVNYSDFDVTKLVFNDVKKNDHGGKFIPVSYQYATGVRPLMIVTPQLMTWGAKSYPTNGSDGDMWSMNIPLGRGVPEAFLNCVHSLDTAAKDHLFKNSKQIFGNTKSKEIVEEFYNPFEKPIVDKISGETTNTFLKMRLPNYGNKFNFAVFNNGPDQTKLFPVEEGQTPDDVIFKNSEVQVLFVINSLYYAAGKYGYTVKAVQISVEPKPPSLMDVSVFAKSKAAASATAVDDSDEEFGVGSDDLNAESDCVL